MIPVTEGPMKGLPPSFVKYMPKEAKPFKAPWANTDGSTLPVLINSQENRMPITVQKQHMANIPHTG